MAKHSFLIKPLVIVGPSGVGKGTLIDLLLQKHPRYFAKSVSHTTRAPRAGEADGVDYHFVKDPQKMHEAIKAGEFIESAVVHGNLYGTSWSSLRALEQSGKAAVLDIDVLGLKQVIAATEPGQLNKVGIVPPSINELRERLKGRGSESEETLTIRMDAACEEIRCIKEDGLVDKVIENSNSWQVGFP